MLTHSEILYSHLVDGSIEPVYLWEKEADLGVPSVVIIHDLFEDIGFYSQDIAWWVDRKYRVFGFNIHYYGNKKNVRYAGSFEKICYNVLQILALIRTHCAMRAPVVYTRGLGALVATRIARKNTKFIAGMITFGPMFALKHPPQGLRDYVLQSMNAIAPHLRIPKFLMPRLSEQTYVTGHIKQSLDDDLAESGEREMDPGNKLESFHRLAENELSMTMGAYPSPRISEGRITFGALQDYLKVIKTSARMCSRLKVPCLFLLPSRSGCLDYRVLYKVQKKFGAMMRFEIQRCEHFDEILHPTPASEFEAMAAKYIIPWCERALQSTEVESHLLSIGQMKAEESTSDYSLGSISLDSLSHDEVDTASLAEPNHDDEPSVVDHTLGAEIDETHGSQVDQVQTSLQISKSV